MGAAFMYVPFVLFEWRGRTSTRESEMYGWRLMLRNGTEGGDVAIAYRRQRR